MATNWLYGALKLSDTDRVYMNTIGQRVVWDAVQAYVAQYRAYVQTVSGIFVAGTTSDFKFRYKLPGAGRMQRRGVMSQAGAVKATGQWDVALPLEDFGDQIAADDVTEAYTTVMEMQRHVDTITIRDMNTRRFEIMKALFNSAQDTFVDPINGSLLIEPLANGDAIVFPPILGAETPATENHYLESGYAATAISDTNNPYITVRNELEEHFGATQGGSNIVAFIHPDEVPETEALTDFDPVNDRFVNPGANTATLATLPAGMPGRVIGRTNGVWVVEWRWLPTGYLVAIDLDAEAPLMERVDPADTNLGSGLQLVTTDDLYPFRMSHWRDRFGYGATNRLSAVVLEFGTGGTYSIPAAYA